MIFIVINTSLSYEIINFIIILICHLNRSGEKTEKKRSEICVTIDLCLRKTLLKMRFN